MEKNVILELKHKFEEAAYEQTGVEYWLSRELQVLLGYSEQRNFINSIEKAKESCKSSGEEVFDHFVDDNKTIKMPNGASKEIPDLMLT